MERKDILLPVPENVQKFHKERMAAKGMFVPSEFLDSIEKACKVCRKSGKNFEIKVLEDGLRREGSMIKIKIENCVTPKDYNLIWDEVREIRGFGNKYSSKKRK